MKFLLNFSGCIVLCVGLALVLKPNFFSTSADTINGYKTIEKRVLWGFLLGVGSFLLFFSGWQSWKTVLLGLLIALIAGVITARTIGLVLDGFFIKQLYWLVIELMVLIILVFLYSLSLKNHI